jgi:hypothetical protein
MTCIISGQITPAKAEKGRMAALPELTKAREAIKDELFRSPNPIELDFRIDAERSRLSAHASTPEELTKISDKILGQWKAQSFWEQPLERKSTVFHGKYRYRFHDAESPIIEVLITVP